MREGSVTGLVSPLGIVEIQQTPDERIGRRMLRQIKRNRIELVPSGFGQDVETLAELYLSRDAVPRRSPADAHHLAWATLADADVLTSWNRRALLRLKTRQKVAIINVALGYKPVLIQTPTEVLGEMGR
jgi:predicted nucleic acid-binding protein